jgi:hypothetical protein
MLMEKVRSPPLVGRKGGADGAKTRVRISGHWEEGTPHPALCASCVQWAWILSQVTLFPHPAELQF